MQQFVQAIARQRRQEIKRRVDRPANHAPHAPQTVTVRHADRADEPVLRALAALEGSAFRPGAWLCAEADGFVTAALRLDDGTVIANPFARTLELRGVLELWARQLTGRRPRRVWRGATA